MILPSELILRAICSEDENIKKISQLEFYNEQLTTQESVI